MKISDVHADAIESQAYRGSYKDQIDDRWPQIWVVRYEGGSRIVAICEIHAQQRRRLQQRK